VILFTTAMLGPQIAAVVFFQIEGGCARLVSVFLVSMSRDPR
jgi:hypothetical protein